MEELFSLPDTAFDSPFHEELSDSQLLQVLKPALTIEKIADETHQDSLERRLASLDYTEEQKTQASLAIQDGISESEILRWFSPETSADVMESLRKLSRP